MRECSICVFRDLLGKTVGRDNKMWMKIYVRSLLVPLHLHMSDADPRVAKVQIARLSIDTKRWGG